MTNDSGVLIAVDAELLGKWWTDNEPWPDWFVAGMVNLAGDPDAMGATLAYQVALRVWKQRPIPPALQEWFNRYTVDGGRVPKRPPARKERDRIEVASYRALFGMSQAEAIRHVARSRGCDAKSVEVNLYR